jgi:hypothetical protein
LGDLGKIKLSPQQKAAVAAAKADAKAATITAKSAAKTSKIAAKAAVAQQKLEAKRAAVASKQAVKDAKAQSKIAIYNAKTAEAAPVDVNTLPAVLPAPVDSGFNAALPFATSSGGGGGGASFAPAESAAPSADDSEPFGIPLPVLLAGGALLAFLMLRR